MRQGIIVRCVAASVVLTVIGAPRHSAAQVQDPVQPAEEEAAHGAVTAAEWVRRFSVPETHDVPMPSVWGVCVHLRVSGRLIGLGVSEREIGAEAADAASGEILRQATARAIGDARLNGFMSALIEDEGDRAGQRITMEIEFAGEPSAMAGRTFDQLSEQIEIGIDGVVLRYGERTQTLFPSQVLATNRGDQMAGLIRGQCNRLGFGLRELDEVRRTADVRAYRFRTLHFAQRAPGRVPSLLFRGETVDGMPGLDVDPMSCADALIDHILLTLRADDEPHGLAGDYLPLTDDFEPAVAGAEEQAMVVWALARAAAIFPWQPTRRQQIENAAVALVVMLNEVGELEAPPPTGLNSPVEMPGVASMIVLAAFESPALREDPAFSPVFAIAENTVRNRLSELSAKDEAIAPAHLRLAAQLLAAGARLHLAGDAAITRASIQSLTSRIESSATGGRLLLIAPWFALVEREFSPPGMTAALAFELRGRQIPAEARHLDLRGGFDLRRGTLRSADSSTALATFLLGVTHVPGDVMTDHTQSLRLALRFLAQLQVTDHDLWGFRHSSRTKGGLAASPWDSRQDVEAQAMGLLAFGEAFRVVGAAK